MNIRESKGIIASISKQSLDSILTSDSRGDALWKESSLKNPSF